MFQYLPLHWGQVKGSNVFVVGTGTYRGKITRNRSCVGAMEDQFFIIKVPADTPENRDYFLTPDSSQEGSR